jgi:uncharacterized membrane protein
MTVHPGYAPTQADRNDALAFIASLVAIAIVLATLAGLPLEPLQLPAGVVVGLFAPGYLLLRATVGGRLQGALRLVLPVPLTLALAALCGLVMDSTPDGVGGHAIGLALCFASVVLALVAVRRGTQPVSWRPTDRRPNVADVLSAPLGRRTQADDAPPLGFDLLLTVAVVIALAIAGLWVVRGLDRAADPASYLALTGQVKNLDQPRAGVARSRVELNVVNDTAREMRPVLRVGTDPPRRGTRLIEQIVRVPASSVRKVAIELNAPCGGAIRAALSDSRSAPALRAVKLRVACARA